MTAKHTPGPWHVGGDGGSHSKGTSRVWAGDRAAVCEISIRRAMGQSVGPEEVANANLIAAAPDLLHRLIAVREWIDTMYSPDDQLHRDYKGRQLSLIDAAIAKAEGRS